MDEESSLQIPLDNKKNELLQGSQSGQEFTGSRSVVQDNFSSDIEDLLQRFKLLSIQSDSPKCDQTPIADFKVKIRNPFASAHNSGQNLLCPDMRAVKVDAFTQKMKKNTSPANKRTYLRPNESKRKITKEQKKRQFNAKIQRLTSPKSPLMAFHELYGDKSITVETISSSRIHQPLYAASIVKDGNVLSTAKHISKIQAKQKVCEIFFRDMLMKKISNGFPKKESMTVGNNVGNETAVPFSRGCGDEPDVDFPWMYFSSMAMYKLIKHWTSNSADDYTDAKVQIGMKKFPDHPENFHPVSLLYIMRPNIIFTDEYIAKIPPLFKIKCMIDDFTFIGLGMKKKHARLECAIKAIKHFWNYDFECSK